jgi:hypothetical protein
VKAALLICLMGCWSCAPERVSDAPPPTPATEAAPVETRTLWLAAGPEAGTVDLHFHRTPDRDGPRQMELFIGYDGLTLQGEIALPAADDAGKRLIVQDDGERVRVILLGAQSIQALDSGPLARLRFAGRGQLQLEARPTIFAPPPANQGVVLGDAFDMGGR